MLNSAVLAAAEAALNRLIRLDTATAAKLKTLAGTRLHVESTLPPFLLRILVHDDGLMLGTGAGETEADAWIRGPAPALVELLLAKSGNYSLYGKDVTVRGDLDKVQRLQHLLLGLRFDWEFYLSRVMGDVPTQAFSDITRKGMDTLRKGSGSLVMDLEEYLHEEKRVFPGRNEVEAFYTGLHALRLDLDRLAARIDLATSRFLASGPDPEK